MSIGEFIAIIICFALFGYMIYRIAKEDADRPDHEAAFRLGGDEIHRHKKKIITIQEFDEHD